MPTLLAIALGSALGGVARFLLATTIDARIPQDINCLGTLVVNVLGCLVIGAAAAASNREWVNYFLMIGVLGGFTTMSSFGLQTLQWLEKDRILAAGCYAAATVVLCLVAVWLGLHAGRWLVGGLSR